MNTTRPLGTSRVAVVDRRGTLVKVVWTQTKRNALVEYRHLAGQSGRDWSETRLSRGEETIASTHPQGDTR